MNKYEYKTVTLDQKRLGLIQSGPIPDLESILNREGKEGWRLCKIVLPSGVFGESTKVIVIFERALEQTES